MKNVIEIGEILRDSVATNQALQDYSNSEFSTNTTVFLGRNVENMPKAEECPIVIIQSTESSSLSEVSEMIPTSFLCFSYVHNEEIIDGTNSKTYAGFQQAEMLRELAMFAIFGSQQDKENNLGKLSIQFESHYQRFFPIFSSGFKVKTEQRRDFCKPLGA